MNGLRAQMEREIDMPSLDSAPLQRLEQEIRQGISLKAEPANDSVPATVARENIP